MWYLTFNGVLPVGDGNGGFDQLHGLLELQSVGDVVGHNSCARGGCSGRETVLIWFACFWVLEPGCDGGMHPKHLCILLC